MKMQQRTPADLSRRNFLQLSAMAGAAASLAPMQTGPRAPAQISAPNDLNEATVAELQAAMAAGLPSTALVRFYLERIAALDQRGPKVNSIIEINQNARAIARRRDAERRAGLVRGPLHGIPVVLKDNIDTADRMQTAAGSLGLVGASAFFDSTVAAKLRAAGAVILGKTNLSEWANFRSFFSSSGWSGRGGQCNNPYATDRNPCGSSSGSGAAPSANFTAVSIGTETDGSIVCPANANGVVGIKPTVGLVSRAGVVPISHTQDTVGPHARTVADAAAVLSAIVSRTPDPRDPATGTSPLGKAGQPRPTPPADYTQFVNPDGLVGARIGVAREFEGHSPKLDVVFEDALAAMRSAGAILVDVMFPHFSDISAGTPEFTVLLFEFKGDLQNYLATRVGVPLAGGTLADAIAFNSARAAQELPFFGQEIFELSEQFNVADPAANQPLGISYNDAQRRAGCRQAVRRHGGHRPAVDAERPRCDRGPDRQPGVADRPDQWRPLLRRELVTGGDRGLPHHQRANGLHVRCARRHQLHGHGLQRAGPDSARLGLRARYAGAPPAAVPAHVALRDEGPAKDRPAGPASRATCHAKVHVAP